MMAGPSPVAPIVLIAAAGFGLLYQGTLDAILPLFFSLFRQRHLLINNIVLDSLPTPTWGRVTGAAVLGLVSIQLFQFSRAKTSQSRWDGPGKVLLFPCKTSHSRAFPKKNSFDYSYLVVGVPVGREGSAGGMVSVGREAPSSLSSWFSWKNQSQRGWYHVDPENYLNRGNGHLGLRGKLDQCLREQGADPAKYPYAYLVTAAKFLGYQFNPVSFWYLYDADKSLAAMVLEVNNTFDERRMYFLTPDDGPENRINDASADSTEAKMPPRVTMKQHWPKDFHVSPFNSRKGSYSLTASDPLSPSMQGVGPIICTINLISSKGHGKLVARLFSDGQAVDPMSITAWQRIRFLASWWWVGFVTFPRIVHQAGILFFQRQLHVWYRPEPLKQSLGRKADTMERQLELVFRRYLRHLVEQSASPLAVKYIPSGISDEAKELMLSKAAHDESAIVEEFEFKVLTPVFYTRFAHYAHDLEALFSELRENNTIWISRPDVLLPKLVIKQPPPTLTLSSPVDFLYFKAIQTLRTRPERIERPLTSSAAPSEKFAASDIRDFRISSMDGYVLACEDSQGRKVYRNAVMKLFLANRVALGSVPLLDAQRFIIQAWLAWILSHTLDGVWERMSSA